MQFKKKMLNNHKLFLKKIRINHKIRNFFMKEVISIVLALVVGFVFVKLLLLVLSVAWYAISFILFGVLIAIFALPVYFIIRKSLFKK